MSIKLLKFTPIISLILFCTSMVSAQRGTPLIEDEFLPLAKKHLKGCRIEAYQFEETTTIPPTKEIDKNLNTETDLRTFIIGEMQRVKREAPLPIAKSGNSFKDMVNGVRIEGRFEMLATYTAITDSYLRTLEATIRRNIFPPTIARTLQQTSSVAVTFLINKDGSITDIEKESSTGSVALDATAISACRSSSPLPPLGGKVDNIARLRLVLTFNPQ